MTKRNKLSLAFLVALLSLCLATMALSVPAFATSTTVDPSADSHVSESNPTTNYGTITPHSLRGSPSNFEKEGFYKFNVSIPGGELIDTASVAFKIHTTQTGNLSLYHVTDNTWTETGVTWNTKPASGTLLGTQAIPASGSVATFTIPLNKIASGDNSYQLKTDVTSADVKVYSNDAASASRPKLTFTSSASALASAKLKGSEVSSWQFDGAEAVNSSVGAKVREAGVQVTRTAAHDCFAADASNAAMTCGSDGHTGTLSRADFRTKIAGIKAQHQDLVWLKLLPISSDTIGTVDGKVFCLPYTDADANYATELTRAKDTAKAQIDEIYNAGYAGTLYLESSNEMEFNCTKGTTGPWDVDSGVNLGGGTVGVSKRIGELYAALMPDVLTYAKTKGFKEVLSVGYMGVMGGPGWSGTASTYCTVDGTKTYGYACGFSARWVDEFNQALVTAGVSAPDIESVHQYAHGGDFDCGPGGTNCLTGTSYDGYDFNDNIVFSFDDNWETQARARLVNYWGSTVGNAIKLSISEWNAGVSISSGNMWTGWSTASMVESFYTNYLQALEDIGFYNANLFCVACNSDTGIPGNYNIIKKDASVPAWYDEFKLYS